jgi:hypothetical protein
MDKKVSIYANWKYDTFDRVLARIGNLDVWEPGFYSRTVTLPDGSEGYLLVGCKEVYKEIVPYKTATTAELIGTIAPAPTFSDADAEGWTRRREPWFTVGTPVLCSDYFPGEDGWDGGRFGIAQYFSGSDYSYPFHVVCEDGARNYPDGVGVVVDFSPASYRYVKKLSAADLTPEQRKIYEAWWAEAHGRPLGFLGGKE